MSIPAPQSWIRATPSGLYCEPGGFHIDPVQTVDRAVITHGHSDHARPGHRRVLATPETIAIMRQRYGESVGASLQRVRYGEKVRVGDVSVRLVPAGHILGSAQVVIDYRGSRVVVSGDYKRRPDPTCAGFEPQHCDLFITQLLSHRKSTSHGDQRRCAKGKCAIEVNVDSLGVALLSLEVCDNRHGGSR